MHKETTAWKYNRTPPTAQQPQQRQWIRWKSTKTSSEWLLVRRASGRDRERGRERSNKEAKLIIHSQRHVDQSQHIMSSRISSAHLCSHWQTHLTATRSLRPTNIKTLQRMLRQKQGKVFHPFRGKLV